MFLKTYILTPKVYCHVHTSLLLVLKGNMFWKLDLFPFSGNRVDRHLHTQGVTEKAILVHWTTLKVTNSMCVYQALGFVSGF
jgi:hypothetical protein